MMLIKLAFPTMVILLLLSYGITSLITKRDTSNPIYMIGVLLSAFIGLGMILVGAFSMCTF